MKYRYIKHYTKVFKKIITSTYPYSRSNLLFSYVRLIARSIAYHKLPSTEIQHLLKCESALGFRIYAMSYPQLINLFEEIFVFQVYHFSTSKVSPVIFDCGSNIGMAILYFKKLYPDSSIIAFEPDRETFKVLQKNIEANALANVTLLNLALYDNTGEMILYKKPAKPDSLNMSLIKPDNETEEEKVCVSRLSDYVQAETDLIKMDVEGSEISLVKDLIQHEKNSFVKNMIIEYHPAITNVSTPEFESILNQNNISCRIVDDHLHAGATERLVYCYRK